MLDSLTLHEPWKYVRDFLAKNVGNCVRLSDQLFNSFMTKAVII